MLPCQLKDLYMTDMFSLIHFQKFRGKKKGKNSDGIWDHFLMISHLRSWLNYTKYVSFPLCILKLALNTGTNNSYSELASEIIQWCHGEFLAH